MQLRLSLAALLIASGLAACGGEDQQQTPPTVEQAMEQLAASNPAAAQLSCQQLLDAEPQNAQAAFCVALTRMLLLPQGPWTQNMLSALGQPPLDMNTNIYGPNGALAQQAAARAGTAALAIECSYEDCDVTPCQTRTDTFTLAPESVIARRYVDDDDGTLWSIDLEVVDVDVNGQSGNRFELSLNAWLDELWGVDWSDGASLAARDLSLWASGLGYDIYAWGDPAETGVIELIAAPTAAGATVELHFADVVVTGSYGERGDDARCTFSGTLSDVLGDELEPPYEPNEYESDGNGTQASPYRDEFVVMLQEDGANLTLGYILAQAELLRAELEALEALLTVVIDNGGATFSFDVPMGIAYITHVESMQVRLAEVRLLRAALRAVLAAFELPFAWDVIDPALPLVDLLTSRQACDCYEVGSCDPNGCTYETECDQRYEVTFSPEALANQLNQHLFVPASSFDLTPGKVWLQQAMDDVIAFAALSSAQSGIFDLSHADVAPFMDEVEGLAQFVKATLDGRTLLPYNQAYWLDLSGLFAAVPIITHAELIAEGDSLGRLFTTEIDDNGGLCSEQVLVPASEGWLELLLEIGLGQYAGADDGDGKPIVTIPVDLGDTACAQSSDCTGGTPGAEYWCDSWADGDSDDDGYCVTEEPNPPVDEDAAAAALDGEDGPPPLFKGDFVDTIQLLDL